MKYITLDLEWNQPYSKRDMVNRPVLLHGEIIQIGAVKMDEQMNVLDTFKIMVKPIRYKQMHKKVTKLTGITTEDLQYGFAFQYALKVFRNWCGENYSFLTWGPTDMAMLKENMQLYKIPWEILPESYDVQLVFDIQIAKEQRQISLKAAMDMLGEEMLEWHDALHDARNTAAICTHLNLESAVAHYAEYTQLLSQRTAIIACDKCLDFPVNVASQATHRSECKRFLCPLCGGNVDFEKYIYQKARRYVAIGQCAEAHEFFAKLRFLKTAEGEYDVFRDVYYLNEEKRAFYEKVQRRRTAKR